jgi:hypothetical protein
MSDKEVHQDPARRPHSICRKSASSKHVLASGVPPKDVAENLGVSVQTHHTSGPLQVDSTVPDVCRCMQSNLGDKSNLVCRTVRQLADSNFGHTGQYKPSSQDHRQ